MFALHTRHVRALTPHPFTMFTIRSPITLIRLSRKICDWSVKYASVNSLFPQRPHCRLVLWLSRSGREIARSPRWPSALLCRSPQPTYGTQSCIVNILAAVTQQSRKLRTRGENGPSWTARLSVREINEQDPENTQWGPLLNFSKR